MNFLIGFLAGLFGGLVGLGGGVIMIPLMVGILKMDQHKAQALLPLYSPGYRAPWLMV